MPARREIQTPVAQYGWQQTRKLNLGWAQKYLRPGSRPVVRGSIKLGPLSGFERTLDLGISAYNLKAAVIDGGAEPPFLAKSGSPHAQSRLSVDR